MFQCPRLVGTKYGYGFPQVVDFWDVEEVEEFKGALPDSRTALSNARVGIFINDANWDAVLEER